jgi:hypothetical protein
VRRCWPIAPRLLLALAEELPDESALAAAVRGGPHHRGWTVTAHLLASVRWISQTCGRSWPPALRRRHALVPVGASTART